MSMYNTKLKSNAFTMIELIVVIIVIAILAGSAIAFFPNKRLSNSANYLTLQIKNRQENALNLNHYKFGDILWKKRDSSKEYDLTCIDLNITGQRTLYGKATLDIQEEQKNIQKHFFIDKNIQINAAGLSDQNQTLCFDGIGRPYSMEQKLLKNIIDIKMKLKNDTKDILVYPFSGYVIIK